MRCGIERKRRYRRAAVSFGYSSLSRFVVALLDGACKGLPEEGWQCGMVYLFADGTVVGGADSPLGPEGVPLPVPGFRVVASGDFWRHLHGFTVSCGA